MTQRKDKPAPKKPKKPKPDAAFDIWLERGLHRLYDDVASEPIPAEMLKLLEETREK